MTGKSGEMDFIITHDTCFKIEYEKLPRPDCRTGEERRSFVETTGIFDFSSVLVSAVMLACIYFAM